MAFNYCDNGRKFNSVKTQRSNSVFFLSCWEPHLPENRKESMGSAILEQKEELVEDMKVTINLRERNRVSLTLQCPEVKREKPSCQTSEEYIFMNSEGR